MTYKEFRDYIKELEKFQTDCSKLAHGMKPYFEMGTVFLGDSLQDSYVKMLESMTGDTGWIQWWVFESWFGTQAEMWAYASPDGTSVNSIRELYKKVFKEGTEIKLHGGEI